MRGLDHKKSSFYIGVFTLISLFLLILGIGRKYLNEPSKQFQPTNYTVPKDIQKEFPALIPVEHPKEKGKG